MTFPEFAWATGEEASDPIVEYGGRRVRVDELARSGHLGRLDADLADVAGLGVRVWRYGMPWRLTEPRPGEYDWWWWDRALAACQRHGLQPVVDLCHFGLPGHYAGFSDPRWVEGFVRYVDAFLARYPAPLWFTPVNEPFITALNSARLGIWNERERDDGCFARALTHVALANVEAMARVRADRDGWFVGAEGFVCPIGDDEWVERVRARVHAVWDLQLGVAPRPPTEKFLAVVDDRLRSRIAALATTACTIAGHDFYPVSLLVQGGRAPALTISQRLELYAIEAASWYERYGVDFWVAETSNLGLPVAEQVAWLEAFVARVARMRRDGLPVRGLCWYSRGDQYDWDTALAAPVGKLTEVGLFDARRRRRPVADVLARLAAESSTPR